MLKKKKKQLKWFPGHGFETTVVFWLASGSLGSQGEETEVVMRASRDTRVALLCLVLLQYDTADVIPFSNIFMLPQQSPKQQEH